LATPTLSGGGTVIWAVAAVLVLAGLYGLHSIALQMEGRGWIYYVRRKPSGRGAAGAFVALQRAIEPPVSHVLHVRDASARLREDDAGGDPGPAEQAPTP
jgi:hypothetical protein